MYFVCTTKLFTLSQVRAPTLFVYFRDTTLGICEDLRVRLTFYQTL